ncbi:hypothetical protein TSUD_103380 [Trifolium subterraneum]|uniref:Uncharacterized protein n=1 Tax=Trifolium subterraneum TaxID=3900 RepID=A0A2Z6NGG6_TRISU|nr:hypothetical protein TSUD_103380 [Trifolium subterraneum]
MAEDDAKKKGKMIDFTTDHHQKEGSDDDVSVNQGDPGDSSTMKEDDAKKKEKMIGSTSDHLQKDSSDDSSTIALMKEGDPRDAMKLFKEGDPSDAMELMKEGDPSDATDLMNAIMSTPKKRKEPTTSTETPSKIRIEERWTPTKSTTAATVKHFHKIHVKI